MRPTLPFIESPYHQGMSSPHLPSSGPSYIPGPQCAPWPLTCHAKTSVLLALISYQDTSIYTLFSSSKILGTSLVAMAVLCHINGITWLRRVLCPFQSKIPIYGLVSKRCQTLLLLSSKPSATAKGWDPSNWPEPTSNTVPLLKS